MDGRFRVREIGRALRSFAEKGHIFLEHLLGKQRVPLFCESSLIHTPFIFKLDSESGQPLGFLIVFHHCNRISKRILPFYCKIFNVAFCLRCVFLYFSTPNKPFGVKIKELWDLDHQIFELNIHNMLIDPQNLIDKHLVPNKE